MQYDDAFKALSEHALGHVKDYSIVGLGSGRAAAALARALGRMVSRNDYHIVGIPTSLQIKGVAEGLGIPLVEADQVDHIDVVFDGADQVDSDGYLIKGGGGAMLRENILFSLAKRVIVMADASKFSRHLDRAVPVEVHPLARTSVPAQIARLGGTARLRTLSRGYPAFTENGNIILDCDFGTITSPRSLTQGIKRIPGVLESGIFLRRPDAIYRARAGGRFDVL